jgi:hypothetical protein
VVSEAIGIEPLAAARFRTFLRTFFQDARLVTGLS